MRKDGVSPHGRATKMTSKREQSEFEPKTAEQYRQAADAHAQTLKDFWKRFLVSGLFVVAAIIIIFACLAWFVSNNQVKAETATISAKGVRYTLTADGAVPGVYESAASQAGLSTIDAMLVSANSNFNNVGEDNGNGSRRATSADVLGPGSYGSLTFTVTPYAKDLRDITIDLQRWLVARNGEVLTGEAAAGGDGATSGESGSADGSASASGEGDASDSLSALQALLCGHILFFQNKGTDPSASDYGYYSNPVTTGSLTIPSSAFRVASSTETTEPYTVTLYWVWPERFQNIALTGTINYTQNLFEQSDAALAEGQKNGYSALLADVDANRNKYFTNVDDITLPAQGEIKEGMSTANLQACAAAYNQADELLGTSVKYVQVRFNSQEASASSGDADA